MTKYLNLDRDPNLSANSDYVISSQKAIKSAIDSTQSSLRTAIDNEETARKNADISLRTDVNANATAIANEGTAREQADLALASDIEAKQDALTTGVGLTMSGAQISAVAMVGATTSSAGTMGAVPAPTIADKDKFLRGDGTWTELTGPAYNPDDHEIVLE